jgi:hypothetical protein
MMENLKRKLLFLLLVAFSSSNYLFAQEIVENQSPLRLLVGCALEFGGDPVAEVYFTDGNTQSVKAGQGVSLALGGEFRLPKAEKFSLRATAGYKYVTTAADNAHIRLTRIPLQLTGNWMAVKNIRLSAGIANHQNIQFNSDGLGENVTLKSTSGPLFEIAYHGVGLTYTSMKYKDQDNLSYAANPIGVSFTTTIGKRKAPAKS